MFSIPSYDFQNGKKFSTWTEAEIYKEKINEPYKITYAEFLDENDYKRQIGQKQKVNYPKASTEQLTESRKKYAQTMKLYNKMYNITKQDKEK